MQVFWDEFNGKRGLNKFNLTLAQLLEKPLMERGLLDAFKERIAEMGGNWDDPNEAADIVDQSLETVVDIAKDINPQFDAQALYNHIDKRDYAVSIERFGMELASYLADKGPDYRLILLADEVSQFINKERDRYLNLQEIITKLSETCHNRVWVACTAQQDLSEILDDCNINDEKDKEGKIKGRFEVKVSLKGTQPEVITQKRILEKNDEAKSHLSAFYDKVKAAFDLQFKLPTAYSAYADEKSFIDFYPFVPYQFKLIMQVFDSFLALGYVAKEVKGNERSIIKVIHATAKREAETELGEFVSFDKLYNSMFEEGLQARGQKAVENALNVAAKYTPDRELARRVANVLFMICNISKNNQLQFPANLDNITTLLVTDMSRPRLTIKNEVEKVVDYLCDNNIIRREEGKNGAPEYFTFYSEEEMKIAELIKSQSVDNNQQAETLKNIFNKYFKSLTNKTTYRTRSFAVGESIKGRTSLSTSPDVVVEFAMDCDYDSPELLALQNQNNRLVFYVGPQFMQNEKLRNQFYWCCKVNSYLAATANDNSQTREEFRKRAGDIYDNFVTKECHKILDSCPVISGVTVISDDAELANKRGNDRFNAALQKHLAGIYTKAALIDNAKVPRNTEALRRAIMRNIEPGEYEGMNASLTPPEKEVELYLSKQFQEVNLSDVVAKFSKAPYGWDAICTLYVVNELVRRHKRDYSYANNPNVETALVAQRIVTETNKFTLREAKALDPALINSFLDAWKSVFGPSATFSTNDSTQLYRMSRYKENGGARALENVISSYRKLFEQNAQYTFVAPLREMEELMQGWLNERDPMVYFNRVIEDSAKAKQLFDQCKEVTAFLNDQLVNYSETVRFVRQNRDNFQYLSEDLTEAIHKLQSIESAQWPIRMKDYMKLRNIVGASIDEQRTDLRQRITDAYSKTYAQLEEGCRQEGVPTNVLTPCEVTIRLKTQSESIPVLQNNLNTDKYFADQSAKILAAKPKLPVDPVDPPQEEYTVVNLRTRTISPLKTEAEVDEYLKGLKQQLMAEISLGHSVKINK
ncbi:MAG: BREX system P-loop protein BrxC [Bacteroidales bacterium]|nr:BREX system P-loop protein BrxC [Bacteroidales bacterium]